MVREGGWLWTGSSVVPTLISVAATRRTKAPEDRVDARDTV